jgi:hypothetical protein
VKATGIEMRSDGLYVCDEIAGWMRVDQSLLLRIVDERDRARAALASVVKQIAEHSTYHADYRVGYPCRWNWDMKLVDAALAEPQPLPARDQEHDGHDGHL